MTRPELRIEQLDPDLPVPAYQHDGDAGLDLYSAEDVEIAAGERVVIGTGIAVAIPEGYAGFTTPRSGTAARHGLSIVNTPGIIDSGYRGEVKMILINLDPREPIVIARGERIAQLLIVPVASVDVLVTDDLGATQRGKGGLGSTGR